MNYSWRARDGGTFRGDDFSKASLATDRVLTGINLNYKFHRTMAQAMEEERLMRRARLGARLGFALAAKPSVESVNLIYLPFIRPTSVAPPDVDQGAGHTT